MENSGLELESILNLAPLKGLYLVVRLDDGKVQRLQLGWKSTAEVQFLGGCENMDLAFTMFLGN